MKEMLFEVRYLKSSEGTILALAGQFKQLSHESEKFRFQIPHFIPHLKSNTFFVSSGTASCIDDPTVVTVDYTSMLYFQD